MILQEILRMVDFDKVVPLFEKCPEKYFVCDWQYYGIQNLHRYKEAFDRMCQIKPEPFRDFCATLRRRNDGGLNLHHPDLGDDFDVACPVYFERDGEEILWSPEHSSYITAEEIACAALMDVPSVNIDSIWLGSHINPTRSEYLLGIHNENPYVMSMFRISERMRKTILPKRFWTQEHYDRESVKYLRAEISGTIKRNRAKRKRHYRWVRRINYLKELARRWKLYTSVAKIVADETERPELWYRIKNAENLGHEGFCSFNMENAAQYIKQTINKYYRGKPIAHDFSLVVVRASVEGIAANKGIEDVIRQSGLCYTPQFLYTTESYFGQVPKEFMVEILYIKNPQKYPHVFAPSPDEAIPYCF